MSISRLSLKHYATFHRWVREATGFYDIGIFANVVKLKHNDYIGACRWGNASLNDAIHIVSYNENLDILDSAYVTDGEDPRCFLFNNVPYALTWKPYSLGSSIVLDYKLINLASRTSITLKVEDIAPSPLHVLGKNWMPLVRDNKLYIIIALEPQLLIVDVNIETGQCKWVTPGFKGCVDVTLSRGGTPFQYCKELNKFIGLGHRSYSGYHHMPFFYSISPDFTHIEIGADINTSRQYVQDPQSIFYYEGKYFCCIGNWNVPNEGCVDMYEILID